MKLSRTILTLMTGTAIALGTVGYGSHAMAADNALSADELTMQAFEQMQSASSPTTAKAKPAATPSMTGPSMTGPSMTGPAIAVPSNVGAVLSGTTQPIAQAPVKERQVRAVAAVPPTTAMPNIPLPRTDGVEIDLGVLNNTSTEQPHPVARQNGAVQKTQAKPQPATPVLDTPATIEISSQTHPGKNSAVSGLLTAPEAVATAQQNPPVIAAAPVKMPTQAPAEKIELPKAPAKTEMAAIAPSEPAVKTVPSHPISAPSPQKLAQKPVVTEKAKVEVRDVVVAASAPKQGTVSTNPDGYTAIIAPKPQKMEPKTAPEIVKAEPPPLPPEAEKVIAQIENVPVNAPRAPDAGTAASFPISMKGKTDAPGIDRVLMQTGRIPSDTITLSKVQSTDPSVPPVPASPVATVAAATVKETEEAPKIIAETTVEPEEAKPAPIILSKAPDTEDQPESTVAEKSEPIKTRTIKVQKIAKNAPIPTEKPVVTAKANDEPAVANDDAAADMVAAIAPAAGEVDTRVTEKIAIDAPVPGRRPAIQNASIEFVERARRTYQAGEVYRVATRTADEDEFERTAPAYKATASYSGGAIPAPTLSVADLGSDPLARQVVDMSAEDIAVALNNIETAAGTGSMMKNNSARPYGTAYDQMPVVQRGFIFRPKDREKEALAEREAMDKAEMDMAQNDMAAVEPQAEHPIAASEAPIAKTEPLVQKPRTLAVPPRPPVTIAPAAPEPITEEPEQKRTDVTTDDAETAMVLAERPDAPRPGRKPVVEDQVATAADLNTLEPAAKGDSAETTVIAEDTPAAIASRTSPISLSYDKGVGTVSDDVLAETMGDLLTRMKDNSDLRVQIVAFASPVDNSQSGSRRTALSRALNVRAWMMENGIDPSRMDVRALGVNPDSPETDRVDMVVVGAEQN